MFNKEVIEILKKSGYDFDYPITKEHISSLMQAAFLSGIHSNNDSPIDV